MSVSPFRLASWPMALAAVAFFMTASTASGQYRGGVTVFTDPEFGGESASFREDAPDLVSFDLNDKISSIRVSPGESWEVCQDVKYANRCQIVTRTIPNLRSIGWDDRISSMRRLGGGRFGRGRPPVSPEPDNQRGIMVFADRNFRGESVSFRDDAPDLVAYELNDKISSVRIPPGESWEVCQDVGFINRCQIITRSISDLRSIGWDDRISSIRRVEGKR